jgi:5-methylcytosine-specific restriction endonuclease McrA
VDVTCPAALARHPWARLKAVDLARLLNSTPLGEVIAVHVVQRHRDRSGGRFYRDRRFDLFAYAAWLFEVYHAPAGERGRRRRSPGAGAAAAADPSLIGAAGGPVTVTGVLALLDRQDYRCALTGWRLTPDTAALDHVVPASRGGPHAIGNAQVLDRRVNRAKGTLGNDEFVALCGAVWRHAQAQERAKRAARAATAAWDPDRAPALAPVNAAPEQNLFTNERSLECNPR